ncbi:hypothetical protein ACFO1B_25485 [Dactylosporangium siamense]|uniref:Uncharacterized protein n=1 Tax=Dactylosporangium siamense TaxID=685454 RepID=A0A919PQ86_9ACTN|nr:hypothetical protein [Dactylosporangium siamense]GIG47346.1 hypothetical protein Dsi01nite_053870 [Dactylosporangium siamense]
MAADSPVPNDPDQSHQHVETLIDELILEILDNADQSQKVTGRGRSPAPGGLLEGVRSTMMRGRSGGSTLERMLIAEALAGVLADAIAPALAEVLAPRIMKVLDDGEEEPAGAARPAKATAARSHTRKSESK